MEGEAQVRFPYRMAECHNIVERKLISVTPHGTDPDRRLREALETCQCQQAYWLRAASNLVEWCSLQRRLDDIG